MCVCVWSEESVGEINKRTQHKQPSPPPVYTSPAHHHHHTLSRVQPSFTFTPLPLPPTASSKHSTCIVALRYYLF